MFLRVTIPLQSFIEARRFGHWKGCVAICFSCVSFKDKSPGLRGYLCERPVRLCYPHFLLYVSRFLSLTSASYSCPGEPLLDSYTLPLLAMMNAFLEFVGVVNRQLPKKNEHRFISVSVTVYAGKDGGVVSYDTFNICCVLLPGDRTIQMQGIYVSTSLILRPHRYSTRFPLD